MNTPRFLIGLSLLFWGWQTRIFIVAVVMALLLEVAYWVKGRWEFETKDLCRVWDLCALIFVAAAVYCFMSRETGNPLMDFIQAGNYTARSRIMNQAIASVFIFFQWWAMVFFPFALAQAYGNVTDPPLRVYSWYLRRKKTFAPGERELTLNFAWPYFGIVLLGAAVTNDRESWFYAGFAALCGLALWCARPKRMQAVVWVCVLLLVAKLGHWGHHGLNQLQQYLEGRLSDWVSSLANRTADASESRTAIGRIGKLKLSGRIIWRLETEGKMPPLAREASYDIYRDGTWRVSFPSAEDVIAENDSTTWPLLPAKPAPEKIFVSGSIRKGQALLVAPSGTAILDNLPAAKVRTNYFGAIRTAEAAPFVRYGANYGPGITFDSVPQTNDHRVPDPEQGAIARVAAELKLNSLDLPHKLKAIENHFLNHFTYSTWLKQDNDAPPKKRYQTPLAHFLLDTKSGHCEYFATATVLLLRQAGVPARYAVGFSVQEPAGSQRYVLRERHAHAWCIYYDAERKAWVDFDTTPGNWLGEEEKENKSFFEPLSDLWSGLSYEFLKWRWLGDRGQLQKYLLIALLLMIAFLAWRIFGRRKRAQSQAAPSASRPSFRSAGTDSEFYLIEKRLGELGLTRLPGETLVQWLARVERSAPWPLQPLLPVVDLHYRHRFDPNGLASAERQQLRDSVHGWLERANAKG